jgi:CubicO group peptidase (beta-lactamase class C family)
MKRFTQPCRVLVVALCGLLSAPWADAFEWTTATPQSQGFAADKLEALRSDLAARHSQALLVIRNDRIVCEWYAPGHAADKKFGTASLAKAIVGGLSLAVVMSDGLVALDDPAAKSIPQWRTDPRKSRITLRQLGSHTAGIADAEVDGQPHQQLTGWQGDFWKRRAVPNDPFTIARDQAPVVFEPGDKMQYSNPGIALMTYCVTAALRDAPHKDIRTLLRERVMRPIGVPDAQWSVGYGQTYTVDGLPLVASWGGGAYTARAAACIGRLMLRGGDWDGRRILSADAVRLTTCDAGTPGPCGMGWWSNNEGDCPRLPRDAFFGSGAGHQILLVVPSLNVIVVRNGSVLSNVAANPQAYHEAYRLYLFEPLLDALSPANPVAR